MLKTMQTNRLLTAVGTFIQNYRGEQLGEVTEIKTDEQGQAEYIILKSNTCFGRGDRFFAIAATANLIHFASNGNIILQTEKDDLQFAKGIAADKLPRQNLIHIPLKSIFELYNYRMPSNQNATNNGRSRNYEVS